MRHAVRARTVTVPAQRDALQARAEVTVALIDAHRNVLEIEALTGAALSSPTR